MLPSSGQIAFPRTRSGSFLIGITPGPPGSYLVGQDSGLTGACLLCIVQFLVLRPLGVLNVAPEVLWQSLLNALLCTVAPVLMVMMAIDGGMFPGN